MDEGLKEPDFVNFPDFFRLSRVALGMLQCLAAALTPIVLVSLATNAFLKSSSVRVALCELNFRWYFVGILKKDPLKPD